MGEDGAVDRGRLEAAAAELEQSLRLESGHPETLYYLGVVRLGLGLEEEARDALRRAAAAGSAEAAARLARLPGG